MGKLIQNGIEVHCNINVHTNLDHKYNNWVFPDKFYAIPEVGDYMDSNEGPDRLLKVCSRTFRMNGDIDIEVTGRSYHS